MEQEVRFQLYSSYDGWYVNAIQIPGNKLLKHWSWDHDNSDFGVGGEFLMFEVLKWALSETTGNYSFYEEEVC